MYKVSFVDRSGKVQTLVFNYDETLSMVTKALKFAGTNFVVETKFEMGVVVE